MDQSRSQRYPWIVAAGEFFTVAIVIGMVNNLYSLYMIPICTDLGISRGTFSIATSLRCLTGMISNFLFSAVYTRFGLRRVKTLGIVLIVLSYVGYAFAQSFTPFVIGGAIFGLMFAFTGTGGSSRIISNWFVSRRDTVLGVVLAASGLGGALLSILLTKLITTVGWRSAFLISAGLQLLTAFLVFFVLKDKPEELGLQPYRETTQSAVRAGHKKVYPNDWEGIPTGSLYRKPFYYLTMAAMLLAAFTTYGYYNQIVAHLRDQGLSPETAASVFSLMLFFLAAAKILTGMLSDRLGAHVATLFCCVCNTVGIVLLALCRTAFPAVLSMLFLGFGLCTQAFLQPLVATLQFGRASFTASVGQMLGVVAVGGLIASPIVNHAFDVIGSYTPVFLVLALLSLIATVLFLFSFILSFRCRRQAEAHAEVK